MGLKARFGHRLFLRTGIALLATGFSLSVHAADTKELEATVTKLAKEKSDLNALVLAKQREIDALTKLLKDNNIDIPESVSAGAAKSGATAVPAPASSVLKGPWQILIMANDDVDVAQLEERLTSEREKLKAAEARVTETQKRSDRVNSARTGYSTRNRVGDYEATKAFSETERKEAKADVRRAEEERRQATANVKRLERQIQDVDKLRTVIGQLDDGTTVELTAEGGALVQIAKGLKVGETYRIAGVGTKNPKGLRVKMTTATPL